MTLSSVVIQVKPEFLIQVINTFKESEYCEYHMDDKKSKIIITIEGNSINEEIEKLKKIQTLPNIISAEMVYSYSEDELLKLDSSISGKMPEWLNDYEIDASEIKYQGDLRKKNI